MKHITKFFTRVALAAVLGVLTAGMAWGQTYSLTPDQASTGSSATTYITTLTEFTYNGISWKMNQWNPKNLQIKTNQSSAASEFRFYNTSAFPGKITQVVITFSALTVSDASKLMFLGGTSEVSATTGGSAGTWDSNSKTLTWTPGASDNFTFFAFYQNGKAASGTNNLASSDAIVVTYETSSSTPTCATPTFSPDAGSYTSAQNVTISSETTGATIYYTTDGSNPTTSSSVYSSAIPVNATTTIKAMAVKSGHNNSSIASATYTIVNLDHAGTSADPYTVADARTAIDANVGITGVYATGIVSEIVTAYNSQYGNISFNFVDAEGDVVTLQAYRCGGNEAANVRVGDVVVVSGNLTKYGSTYEFESGCQLVSLTHPVVPSITVSPSTINAPAAGTDGIITVTYNNITDVAADVAFYASDGTTAATYDWITVDIDSDDNVAYLIDENTSSVSRSAYMKVWAYDDNLNEVYSELITFTQAEFVPDYAELPFEFDGGRSDISTTYGLTQNGIGTDYADSPKLKFDGTGDYLILKIDEVPGKLTFDIKGNSFSGGTFKVQTSDDGETYTDLATYTSLDNTTQNEVFKNLASTVRYIKWIYTNKSNGNVALGNIKLATYVAPEEYTLTVGELRHVNLFIFGGDESETIISTEQGQSTAQVLSGTNVEISVDVAAGCVLQSLVVDGTDVTDEIDSTTGMYVFEMPNHNVTITASAEVQTFPAPGYWVLTSLADLTADDVFVIVGDNGDTYAMLNDNGTSAPTAVSVTVDDNTLSGVIPETIKWNLSITDDGYIFYPNGTTETWLYCTNSNNGVKIGTGDAKHFTLSENGYLTTAETTDQRYIGIYNSQDWRCYTSEGGNIADQTFAFYKKVDAPATINLTPVLNNGRYWTTFYNGSARYTLPEGAQAFTMNANHELYRLGTDGSVIPANTAVIIIVDVPGVITLTKSSDTTAVAVHDAAGVTPVNILAGSNAPVTVAGISGTPYALGIVNGVLGFYQYTGTAIPAGKAYYVVSE